MRPDRRLMDPSTLEMLIMLRFNKDICGTLREVDEAIKRIARKDETESFHAAAHQLRLLGLFLLPLKCCVILPRPLFRQCKERLNYNGQ